MFRRSLLSGLRPFSSSATRLQLSEGEATLKSKILSSLPDAQVEVQDVSGGCGTFYAISVSDAAFKGMTTIKQHRMINDLLKDDIKGMHGIQVCKDYGLGTSQL